MKTYKRRPVISKEAAADLAGEFLDSSHFDLLIDSDADVIRADGSPLLHFRRRRIPENQASAAFHALYNAATEYGNRGMAAGKDRLREIVSDKTVTSSTTRVQQIRQDGTMSNTTRAATVPSGIIGSFDRNARFPYCRLTKFTTDYADRIRQAMPFIQTVDSVFAECSPERYAYQLSQCKRTQPEYIFPGTAFSTITVNKNWRTATHQDAGDLKGGFGVLSVLSEGKYTGGWFVVPRYGVAVNMRHGDVLLVDVHEWHGNTELVGVSKYWTRLSTVFYFRSKMVACKSIAEELEIAKRRVAGTKMYADFKGEFPI